MSCATPVRPEIGALLMVTCTSDTQRYLPIWLLLIAGLVSLHPRTACGADQQLIGPFAELSPSSDLSAPAQVSEDREIPYSEFIDRVSRHQIASIVISGRSIHGVMRDGSFFSTMSPDANHTAVVDALIRDDARVAAAPPPLFTGASVTWLIRALDASLPMLLLIVAWWYLNHASRDAPGGSGLTSMRRSPGRQLAPGEVKVRLRDVAGIDEVRQEVAEIIDYLRDPTKYTALGAKVPRGALLVGPPGTGKTLLARAIAGEAGVPFFSNCGSAFVELYVGVGAARVRDLFTQAKLRSPCIVFIDEIDAIGGHRSAGGPGANEEREQKRLTNPASSARPSRGGRWKVSCAPCSVAEPPKSSSSAPSQSPPAQQMIWRWRTSWPAGWWRNTVSARRSGRSAICVHRRRRSPARAPE